MGEDFLCERLEAITLCNEVRLTIEFENNAEVSFHLCGHKTVRCRATFALGYALESFDADNVDCLVEVAIGFYECVLAIEHSCCCEFTQLLYVCGGVVRQDVSLLSGLRGGFSNNSFFNCYRYWCFDYCFNWCNFCNRGGGIENFLSDRFDCSRLVGRGNL